MKITNVQFTPGFSSFFFDDQAAIKSGAAQDGFPYATSAPVTHGFETIRQPGECISVLLRLESGQWAEGDCRRRAVFRGRWPRPFVLHGALYPADERYSASAFAGLDVSKFTDNARFFDALSKAMEVNFTRPSAWIVSSVAGCDGEGVGTALMKSFAMNMIFPSTCRPSSCSVRVAMIVMAPLIKW